MAIVKKRLALRTSTLPTWRACFIALGLLLGGGLAQAETIPATVSTQVVNPAYEIYGSSDCIEYINGSGQIRFANTPSELAQKTFEACNAEWAAYRPECVFTSWGNLDTVNRTYWLIRNGAACREYSPSVLAYYGTFYNQCLAPAYYVSGQGCVVNIHNCPSTGDWTLSTDKLICSRCPTPLILNADNACVGLDDKGGGAPNCQENLFDQPQLPPWSTSP